MMNWLHKIAQKQMPLPIAPPDLERGKGGIVGIDNRMYDETSYTLKQRFPNINYGGAGEFGIVFKTGPGEMAKVTRDGTEVENATQAFYNQYDWVVPILEIPRQIQENPSLWMIRMKELKKVPKNEQGVIKNLIYFGWGAYTLEDIIKNFAGIINPERLAEMYEQLKHVNEQNSNSLRLTDLHGGNFGIDPDDGRLKVLDLGADFDDSDAF